MEDLSGLNQEPDNWYDLSNAGEILRPVLLEIGRSYTSVMRANAKAVMAGDKTLCTEVGGAPWTNPHLDIRLRLSAGTGV